MFAYDDGRLQQVVAHGGSTFFVFVGHNVNYWHGLRSVCFSFSTYW